MFSSLGAIARDISSPTGIASFLSRVFSSFGKGKNDKEFIKAMQDVGDLLLLKNVNPLRIKFLLEKGTQKEIELAVKAAMKKKNNPIITSLPVLGLAQGGERLTQ